MLLSYAATAIQETLTAMGELLLPACLLPPRVPLVLTCGLFHFVLLYAGAQREKWTSGAVRYHKDYPCNQTISVPAFAAGYIDFPDIPPSTHYYCQLLIGTWDKGYRIRVTFNGTLQTSTMQDITCEDEYVHVGNSRYAVDIKSMTSYKFCESETPQEVVSRGRKLWVVYSTNGGQRFTGVRIKYESLPYVRCVSSGNSSYFRCSPVECIPYEQLCDGRIHCSNGRDEYCDRIQVSGDHTLSDALQPLSVQRKYTLPAMWYMPSSLDGLRCFVCEDGTCIRPTLPIYHVNRGQPWWWLCDLFPHCKDRTDERMDVCLTMKSKSSALYDCPSGGRRDITSQDLMSQEWYSAGNISAVLWRRLTCDDVRHCHDGEDEDAILCAPKIDNRSHLRDKIIIPFVALVIFIFTLTIVYNRDKCLRRQKHSRHASSSGHGSGRKSVHHRDQTDQNAIVEEAAVIVEEDLERGRHHPSRHKHNPSRHKPNSTRHEPNSSRPQPNKPAKLRHPATPIEEPLVCGNSKPGDDMNVQHEEKTKSKGQHPNYFILSQTAV